MNTDWIYNLFMGTGVAHSVLLVALVIAAGLFLSRIKIGGISLGVTWILFAGIACGHFGMVLDPTTSHFVKEFGLILFIYSIGLQVGPGFFSSFRKGGVTYNMLATAIVLLGGVTAYAIHLVTGESLFAMIGVLYGAVTNTPGLGAAQQTFSDMHEGAQNSLFAQGYAMAYPLGVVGIILCIVLIKKIFRIDLDEEQKTYKEHSLNYAAMVQGATIEVTNEGVDGKTMAELSKIAGREIVVSRLMHRNSQDVQLVEGQTRLQKGDRIIAINGSPVDSYNEFTDQIGRLSDVMAVAKTSEDSMKVRRATIAFTRGETTDTAEVVLSPELTVGFFVKTLAGVYKPYTREYGFFESIPAGIKYGWNVLAGYVDDMKYVFTADGAKSLGGFGAIGSLFPPVWDWYLFWKMTAFLSIILAFMNILPIPALDGGHVLFLMYEAITRRKPSEQFMIRAEYVGFGILILLMVVANLNDILRWLGYL